MTLTQLRADARRKVSFQITSTEYPDADVDVSLNQWLRTITGWVIGASGIWEFSGEKSTADLVQDQIEYVLPAGMVFLNRVAIKYPNSTMYAYAERLDDQQTKEAFENGTISRGSEAAPVFREFDNSIFIYPKPSAAVTAGLAIETAEDITELASGGDLPNLNPLVHRALSIGAAMDYCDIEEMGKRFASLERQMLGRPGGDGKDGLKYLIEELAANRDKTTRGRFIPRARSYR